VNLGIIFKLSDQKVQIFLFLITLTRWFSERARKIFGEMAKKT
jgi:hypothetical protein